MTSNIHYRDFEVTLKFIHAGKLYMMRSPLSKWEVAALEGPVPNGVFPDRITRVEVHAISQNVQTLQQPIGIEESEEDA
jgi:hypothetical protein